MSPGTTTRSSSSSSTLPTEARRPTQRTSTPAARSIRSVWSRVGEGVMTAVSPSATRPAIRTQDLTCALAAGSSYSMPWRRAPSTVKGGNRPSRASTRAPIMRSGSAILSTGRRRIDASPSSVQRAPSCPASHPGSSRISVPALPTSIGPSGTSMLRRPPPRTTTSSGRCSISTPRSRIASSVELVSPASR